MEVIGIVAEYNPFHNGHLYQIKKIKEEYPDSILVVVISSYITQRGEICLINKWNRCKICLEYNIDIVLELPSVFSMQSADNFAKGAIKILNTLGCTRVVFGSEEDNLNKLKKCAVLQNSYEFTKKLKYYMDNGNSYPTSLCKVTSDILGYSVSSPNDLLGISYIKAINEINKNIEVSLIKRTNSYYSDDIKDNITSGSNIRNLLKDGLGITNYIPNYDLDYINRLDYDLIFNYLKYQIICNKDTLDKYLDVNEGIENRILKYLNRSYDIEEFILNIKSKRYTYNKVRRMLAHIVFNYTKDMASYDEINYIRVLGFNNDGKKYLNKIKRDIDVRIITGYEKNVSKILDYEITVSEIYNLITSDNTKREYDKKPIMK